MQIETKNKAGIHTKRLLSANDAGEYLSISHWTVRALIDRGLLPYVRIGRRLLIDVRDLDRYIESLKNKVLP